MNLEIVNAEEVLIELGALRAQNLALKVLLDNINQRLKKVEHKTAGLCRMGDLDGNV